MKKRGHDSFLAGKKSEAHLGYIVSSRPAWVNKSGQFSSPCPVCSRFQVQCPLCTYTGKIRHKLLSVVFVTQSSKIELYLLWLRARGPALPTIARGKQPIYLPPEEWANKCNSARWTIIYQEKEWDAATCYNRDILGKNTDGAGEVA